MHRGRGASSAIAATCGSGRSVAGTAERPRLVVFRSLKHIYAQLVNDDRGVALLGVTDRSEGVGRDGAGKVARGKAVGKLLAEKARAAGITPVVFDRGGYRYHGRVQGRGRRRPRGRIGVLDDGR